MTYPFLLKQWRDYRGLTQQQLADAADTSKGYVSQFESGDRRYNQDFVERFARALNCTPSQLLGQMPGQDTRGIPIAGRAAAGPEGFYFSDYADGAHDTLDPFPDGSIAAVVTGRSMWPRFKENEKIIFGPMTKDIDSHIGHDVLAHLSDGRMLIKTLKIERGIGSYSLVSYNQDYDDIVGVNIEWVRPFEGMRA